MDSKDYQEKTVDNSKLRNDLISLYERFIRNPNNEVILEEMAGYSGKYGGLTAYADMAKNPPVSKDVLDALKETSASFQYKMETFPKEELITKAKEILENLKKNQ